MIIKILSENTSVSPKYLSEHGLSIFIESNNTILFDTGSSDNFATNAQKMNVDLKDVEYAFISHGHYDHGGGISTFLEINDKAKVFIDCRAFEEKYSEDKKNCEKVYIGIDKSLMSHTRITLIKDDILTINNNLMLFSVAKAKEKLPIANSTLYHKTAEGVVNDNFKDERNLIIKEGERSFLFAGCAHRGILNILKEAKRLLGKYPDYVIGGFHLHGKIISESPKQINKLAKKLARTKAKYITCHCTGREEYELIKAVLSDNIQYASCGAVIRL